MVIDYKKYDWIILISLYCDGTLSNRTMGAGKTPILKKLIRYAIACSSNSYPALLRDFQAKPSFTFGANIAGKRGMDMA